MKSFLPTALLSMFFLSIITYSEVSGKDLKCFALSFTTEETEKTCSGVDPVCVTYVLKDTNDVMGKRCGERDFIKFWCDTDEKEGYNKCLDPCDTDLCNDEK